MSHPWTQGDTLSDEEVIENMRQRRATFHTTQPDEEPDVDENVFN